MTAKIVSSGWIYIGVYYLLATIIIVHGIIIEIVIGRKGSDLGDSYQGAVFNQFELLRWVGKHGFWFSFQQLGGCGSTTVDLSPRRIDNSNRHYRPGHFNSLKYLNRMIWFRFKCMINKNSRSADKWAMPPPIIIIEVWNERSCCRHVEWHTLWQPTNVESP